MEITLLLATPLRLQVELKQGGGSTPRNEIYVEVLDLIEANLYAPSMGVTSLSPTRHRLDIVLTGALDTEDASVRVPLSLGNQLPIRAPGTQPKNCRWYDIGCHVMNLAKSMANSIYQGMRECALNKLKAKLDRVEAEAGRGTDAFRTLPYAISRA